MIAVRRAGLADVPAMSQVLTASITELCHADHRGDAGIIAGWTRNKSPESVAHWVENPTLVMLVATFDDEVAAVGSLSRPDEVGLNYVSPAFRFRGVSSALLAALEEEMRGRGTQVARLTSTQTAHGFYRARGWEDAGRPVLGHNVPGYPMQKRLAGAPQA